MNNLLASNFIRYALQLYFLAIVHVLLEEISFKKLQEPENYILESSDKFYNVSISKALYL